jgi:crotonobetainyl-CoA:carnitine CoA-transferase CaiB-like acyl-CoA transferase
MYLSVYMVQLLISSERDVPGFWKEMDWSTFDLAKTSQIATQAQYNQLAEIFKDFFAAHTKEELYQGARERNMMLYPVTTTEDIKNNSQLESREFWQEVKHPELGATIEYPGAFVKLSDTPINIKFRAPLIGEHNYEIYNKELGFSSEKLSHLKKSGVI